MVLDLYQQLSFSFFLVLKIELESRFQYSSREFFEMAEHERDDVLMGKHHKSDQQMEPPDEHS